MPQLAAEKIAAPAAPSNTPGKTSGTAPAVKRPRVAYASESWLPARVARRLMQRNGARVAGLRALAQRDRVTEVRNGEVYVRDAWRWLYWTTVIETIERWGAIRILDRRVA